MNARAWNDQQPAWGITKHYRNLPCNIFVTYIFVSNPFFFGRIFHSASYIQLRPWFFLFLCRFRLERRLFLRSNTIFIKLVHLRFNLASQLREFLQPLTSFYSICFRALFAHSIWGISARILKFNDVLEFSEFEF